MSEVLQVPDGTVEPKAGQGEKLNSAIDSQFEASSELSLLLESIDELSKVSVKDGRDIDTGAVTDANLIPDGAKAVTYNLAIVNTVAAGWLFVADGEATEVKAATINWYSSGQILNNGSVVQLNTGREVKVFCGGPGASTHFVIDVTGYWI